MMQQRDFMWNTFDGLKVHATEWRPEGDIKASVALVHGLGEHIGRYQHVAEFFADEGFALAGFDLRGHGKTEGVRGHSPSYEALMQDISANISICHENFPEKPVFLYGHSLGGNLTLYYCLTQKSNIKGAIVTSPGLGTAEPVPALKVFLGKLMYKLAPAMQMENGLDRSGLSRDPEVEKKYSSDPLVHSKISARWALDMLNNGQYIIKHAQELVVPTLLMIGTSDKLVNVGLCREFARATNQTALTYKEWPGFYHELHNEPEKSQVLLAMTKWMEDRLA